MSGKGSQRRPEAKKGSFREGHAAIDWSKGRHTSPRAKRGTFSLDYTYDKDHPFSGVTLGNLKRTLKDGEKCEGCDIYAPCLICGRVDARGQAALYQVIRKDPS